MKKISDPRKFLVVGMAAFLCLGVMNTWSILKVPLQTEFGWTAAQLSLNFTISFSFFCIGGWLGSRLTKFFPHKTVLLGAAAAILIGEWMTSHVTESRLFYLYLGNGVLCGLGIGTAYNVIISLLYPWFPGRTGICSGLLMMAYGVSSLLLGTLAETLIGMESFGWKNTFLSFGLIMAAALFAAAHILRLPEEGEVKQPKAIEDRTARSYTSAEMLRSPKFYLLFLSLVCIAAIGNSFFSFLRDYAVSLGFSAATAAALVGLCSVCNGIGRVLCGLSFDRAGWRVVMPVVAILAIVSAALALLSVSAGLSWLAVITICLMGASFGCCPVISMSATSVFFGPKHYSENLGIQNFNLMGASFCASVSGLLITREGGFVSALYFLLGLGVAALLLIFVLKALKEEKISSAE